MNISFIIAFIITILVLYVILKILSLPVKLIIKLIINAIVGGIVIYLINLIGVGFGFTLALNWVTAIIVGILGIPGVIIVTILHFII